MTELDAKDYWESLHRKDYGLSSVGYTGVGTPFNAWMYRVRRAVFRRTVRPFIQERGDAEVLDVGSGTGFYLDRWRELGLERITGSDTSAVAVEHLQRRYPSAEVVQLDIGAEPAGLAGRQFDIVSVVDVLFHITDDLAYRRAFENLSVLVRPGGLLVLSENFLHGNASTGTQQVNRSVTEIGSLLGGAGFEPLLRRPMFFLMNYPVDSASVLHKLCWRTLVLAMAAWNPLGAVVGAVLYPLEMLLVARLKEGPSTELMVCRRRSGSA